MYLDSAILVKLVVLEPDSGFYADLADGARHVWSSELAIAECRSAIGRKRAGGELDARTADRAWKTLQGYWTTGGLALAGVTREVIQDAGEAIARCGARVPLRTLDALHLATCLRIRAFPLVTNDAVMRAAGEALGVPLGPLP